MNDLFSLRNIVMFSQLSEKDLDSVSAALKKRVLAAGEVIFNQGDPGDELIIVVEGRVAIYAPSAGANAGGQTIRIFQPGEMLGEMALIDQKPRSLSARAATETTILALSKDDFRKLLLQNPETALSVMAGLSDRIRYTTEFLSEVREWVQRIAAGSYQTGGYLESSKYQDQTLASLAAEFAQMAARVQEREDTLRKEVAQLRIEIDQTKRQQEASRIMESDYYQKLKEKVKDLRGK